MCLAAFLVYGAKVIHPRIHRCLNHYILVLEDLLNSGVLKTVPNFSKFLHGAAVLFPDEIVQAPPWFVRNSSGQMIPGTLEQVTKLFEQVRVVTVYKLFCQYFFHIWSPVESAFMRKIFYQNLFWSIFCAHLT